MDIILLILFIFILAAVMGCFTYYLETVYFPKKYFGQIIKTKESEKRMEKFTVHHKKYRKIYYFLNIFFAFLAIFIILVNPFGINFSGDEWMNYLLILGGFALFLLARFKPAYFVNQSTYVSWSLQWGEEKVDNFYYLMGSLAIILGIIFLIV